MHVEQKVMVFNPFDAGKSGNPCIFAVRKHITKEVVTMARKPFEPITLTPEMKKTLQDMEADIETLKFELEKAKRAGIDVTDLAKRFEEMKTLRTGLLKEYS